MEKSDCGKSTWLNDFTPPQVHIGYFMASVVVCFVILSCELGGVGGIHK